VLLLLLLQVLLQHNHVIKQAADDNIGYVLEQEGNSFTLAFHDPHDAAAFALQVSGTCMQHVQAGGRCGCSSVCAAVVVVDSL
jgi:hypothetical protein